MSTNYNITTVKENLPRMSTSAGMCARNGIMPTQGKAKAGGLSVRAMGAPAPVRAKVIGAGLAPAPQRAVLKEIHNRSLNTKVGSICKEVTNLSIRPKPDKVLKPLQQKTLRPPQDKARKPAPLKSQAAGGDGKHAGRREGDGKDAAPEPAEDEAAVTEAEPPSYSTLQMPAEVQDIDRADKGNLLLVFDYTEDIYKYLRQLEVKYPIKRNHLSSSHVTPRMRAILVNWLLEVHSQFQLLVETLYLAVSIVDRFLQEDHTVSQVNLQLVGVTALFLASKYEEMLPPEVSEFVFVTDKACSRDDVLSMEFPILEKLEVSLGQPSPIHFLRRFSKAAQATSELHTLAKYVLELSLLECSMCHVRPSIAAAAALYVALYVLSAGKSGRGLWSSTLQHYTQYSEAEVLPTARKLASLVLAAPSSKHQSVYRKYSSSKFGKTSLRSDLVKLEALAS